MALNVFRICGDMLNVLVFVALMARFMTSRNAQAISLRSLEMLVMVCVSRYLDLFTTFYNLYNSCMKVFYVIVSATAALKIRFHESLRTTYDASLDSYPHWRIVIGSFALAVMVHLMGSGIRGFYLMELLWTFSICLEAFLLVPQLYLLRNYDHVECLTGTYIFCKGVYRMFYILNWVYRAHTERYYRHHYLVYAFGVIQSLIGGYAVFELRDKGWSPSELFTITTYTQPRLSRLKQSVDAENNEIEVNSSGTPTALQEPLLVV